MLFGTQLPPGAPVVGPEARRALAQLLVRLCAGAPAGALAPGVADRLPDRAVRRHGLAPAAFRLGVARYREDFLRSAGLAMRREQLLAAALAALAGAGVRVALLKGISYCTTLYEDPAERPMGDVDLLVSAEQHGAAVRTLTASGYGDVSSRVSSAFLHHAVTLQRGSLVIDLHRRMIQPLRSRVDMAGVWARARPAAERDDGAFRLDPVDEALLHLVHVARHELRVPLMGYLDAARLLARLPSAERAELRARAGAWRLGRAVEAARGMTEALAGGGAVLGRLDGGGEASETLPGFGAAFLPDPTEVLEGRQPGRALQLVRKLALLEGPRELAGLAAVVAVEQVAAARARRHARHRR